MHITQARTRYVRWLEVTRDLSRHTIRAYAGDIMALERHAGPAAPVGAIDRDLLLAFVESQRTAGLAVATVKRRVSGLRSFCRWLWRSGALDADPWETATVVLGRSRRLPRAVPTTDLDRLFVVLCHAAGLSEGPVPRTGATRTLADPHEATTLLAVALMVATGIRVHEVVSLRCQDLDLPGRSLRITGKGRRERHVYLPNAWLADLVGAYLDTREAIGVEHSELLFNLRRRPLTPAAVRDRLSKAARTAGLGRHVTPHMLRHTAATQLIEAGVDIRYIQRLLGHASLSTTEIYTHVSDHALRRVVSDADVLGAFVRG